MICTCSSLTVTVTVSSIWPANTSMPLTILSYKVNNMGSATADNGIRVYHYDGSGALCDDNTGAPLVFALSCPMVNGSLFCQTCLTSNTSSCVSCYPASLSISTLIYLKNASCTNNCSSLFEYYPDGSNACVACQSPCLTCQSLSLCISCVATTAYLYENNTCQASCVYSGFASYSIAAGGVLRCLPCSTTCSACALSATNCTSCSDATLVANMVLGACVPSCPAGYYNNSGQCSACLSVCAVCANNYSCTACVNSSYVLTQSGQCVSQCPSQVSVNGVCMCNTNCLTCSGSISNCLTCSASTFLEGTSCVLTCTQPSYLSNSTCVSCKQGCSACTITGCSSCSANYYYFSGACVGDCPSALGAGYVNSPSASPASCVKCATGCNMCDTSNPANCSSCLDSYSFNSVSRLCESSGSATVVCPSGYEVSGASCVVSSTTATGKVTVVMYTLALVGWTAFGLLSKILAKQVYLQYAMNSGLAVLELSVCLVLLGFTAGLGSSSRRLLATTLTWSGSLCVMVALAMNYLLNLAHLWVYCRYLATDPEFPKNKKAARNRHLNTALLVAATLTNFRLYQIVFSCLCGAKLFKTRLQFVGKLLPLNLLNCCMIVVSVLALAGFGLVCADSVSSETQYYVAILGIVISVLGVIFTLASFSKDDDFFETVCKYEASDAISNTEEALDKGEEYHFDGSKAQSKYKVLN